MRRRHSRGYDLLPLAERPLHFHARRLGKSIDGFAPEAADLLTGYYRGDQLGLRYRRVGMRGVGNETLALAVHEQVELLEHGLPDQDLVTQHQGFLERVSPFKLDDERFRHAHGLRAAIRVLGHPLTPNSETETRDDLRRPDHAHGAGAGSARSRTAHHAPAETRRGPELRVIRKVTPMKGNSARLRGRARGKFELADSGTLFLLAGPEPD